MPIKVKLPHKFELEYVMFPWQERTLSHGWRTSAILRLVTKKFKTLLTTPVAPERVKYSSGISFGMPEGGTIRFLDQTAGGIEPYYGAYVRKIQSSSRAFRGTPTAEHLNQLASAQMNICPIDRRPNTHYTIPGGEVFDYKSSVVLRILKSRQHKYE